MTRRHDLFASVHTEGSLLPPDLLQRVMDRDKALAGLRPEDYHHEGERLNELTAASWQRLQGRWLAFKEARAKLAAGESGTTETRERWLLPLFQELDYGRLLTAKAVDVDGRSYPVSHGWSHTPIHFVGCNADLDRKTAGLVGAARTSPHSLVQELLNRSDDHLWAFVSNGLRLRILRDNVSLSRQAYVEFDLEAMMEGELYSDFVLLWLLCHQSRVEGERPEECWLEKWSQEAQQQGVRALDGLRKGVERAISALGSGFLRQPGNQQLLDALRDGTLETQEYYRQLLRMVYRLLFLFTAEDRGLLLVQTASESAAATYAAYYSTDRLRRLAERRRGSRHTDLYEGLSLVIQKLGDSGCPELGLPALGSMLFSEASVAGLLGCRLANRDLLEVIRHLAFTNDGRSLRPIDFRNLGAEELGSVYESLLEMQPKVDREAAKFELNVVSGSERKTTGSYYTPSSLIQCLLDTALDPVVDERLAATPPDGRERALLDLKICDPACGSGHFLIAAAHRLARRLAAVRTGDEEPAPDATRHALRDVIGHCIYGVDINPMAVELCKVNLWMEALEPGKPLSFLYHRIQCGNSLLGATPALLRDGIPDAAFTAIEGDDKTVCTELRKQNRKEREGQTSLFGRALQPWQRLGNLAVGMMDLDDIDDATPDGVSQKQERYERVVRSSDYLSGKLLADTWCAAFVQVKTTANAHPITEEVFRKIEENPHSVSAALRDDVRRLAESYRFFHWHLQFPDVFRVPADGAAAENEQTGWMGGFDVVLGNPPWEQTELKEKEFFASLRPDIAEAATGAIRKRMIADLAGLDSSVFAAYVVAKREHQVAAFFAASSGRYPLCGRGRINTYALFAELKRALLSPHGRVGCIVPSGIATDDSTKFFFQALMETASLATLYGLENEESVFPAVHHAFKFCLLTMTGAMRRVGRARIVFFARSVADLGDETRAFELTLADVRLLNPNTLTCPIFRSGRDADITRRIYRHAPVLLRERAPAANPWRLQFKQGDFNMTSDSHLFRTQADLVTAGCELRGNTFWNAGRRYLPLYEGKMIWLYDHRFGTYQGQTDAQERQGKLPELTDSDHVNQSLLPLPKFWVDERDVDTETLERRPVIVGFRDITSAVVARTSIACIVPQVLFGNKLPMLILPDDRSADAALLVACLSSYIFDYTSRQKLGGSNMNFFILKQLPVIPPWRFREPCPWDPATSVADWVWTKALELIYTAEDLRPWAEASGYHGPPFRWDPKRRLALTTQLDAAFFHLYGLNHEEVEHVMNTFRIIREREEATCGEYRTKRLILAEYRRLKEASAR